MKNIFKSLNGTNIFAIEEAHPHRIDLSAEAIAKMVVPTAPADPADRNQTRVCETVDLGRVIGQNHLVEINEDDLTFMWDRGRGYESHMVLKETEDETRLTTVLFWDANNSRWVLWTNFEGVEGFPEPGSDRYNKGSDEFKALCREFWKTHALVPTEEERKKIEETPNWSFSTLEDESGYETAHNQYFDTFDECIGVYNTAKQLLKTEWWMRDVDEPSVY